MQDETQQPIPEPTQSEPISTPPVETPIPEPNPAPESPQEPLPDAPISPADPQPAEVPPVAPEATTSPEDAVMVKDQNPANEPLESAPILENTSVPENPNITVEKHGNDVTIPEVMQLKEETAQMAGNEPLSSESDQVKTRKENLIKANEKRKSKKLEKINEILNLFS